MSNLRFSAKQKIKGVKTINALFSEPNIVLSHPLKAFFCIEKNSKAELKIAVSVSKRRFKKSPDRNRIKRIIRESYRINQKEIKDNEELAGELLVMIVYIGKELPEMDDLNKSIKKLFVKIKKRINN